MDTRPIVIDPRNSVGAPPPEIPSASGASERNRTDDIAVTLRQGSMRLRPPSVVLYTRRYAMLAMFAALGFLQCAVWNTWGPIASSVVLAYPALNSANIATLALWGPVTCITGTIFFTVLIQKKGLRATMVLSTLLMALGTGARLLTEDPEYFIVSAHVGAILNGFAGVVVGIAPALLSTLWFPISFRTTATGIGCTFNQLGNAGGFFLGPLMVQPPDMVHLQQQLVVETVNKRVIDMLDAYQRENGGAALNYEVANSSSYYIPENSRINSTYYNGSYRGHNNRNGIPTFDNSTSDLDSFLDAFHMNMTKMIKEEHVSLWAKFGGTLQPRIFSYPAQIGHVDEGSKPSLNSTVTPQVQALLRYSIRNYMYIVAGLSVALLVLVVAFFESEPPSPPVAPLMGPDHSSYYTSSILSSPRDTSLSSVSSPHRTREDSSEDEEEDDDGPLVPSDRQRQHQSSASRSVSTTFDSVPSEDRSISEMLRLSVLPLRNCSFLLMLLAYSLTLGINVAWSSVLEINLEPLGVSQHTASWVGVYITFGGVMLALVMARLSDYLFGQLKLTILCLMLGATVCYLWFLMIANGCIPFSNWQMQLSTSLAGSLNYAVSPLFFELSMELGHPVPEDVLGSIMTVSWNCVGIVLLFFMQLQGDSLTSVLWIDYLLVAQGVAVVLIMLFVKEEYKRSGPIKIEEIRNTIRERQAEEGLDDDGGYGVSDDSDVEDEGEDDDAGAPASAAPPQDVKLLVESSSDDSTGRDNAAAAGDSLGRDYP